MSEVVFLASTYLPLPREQLFAMLEDPGQLWRWMPAELGFQLLRASHARLGKGTVLEYELRFLGRRESCRSEIVEWDPPARFVDQMTEGPLPLLRQTHEFVDALGSTVLEEELRYQHPPGWEDRGPLFLKLLQRHAGNRRYALWSNLIGQPPPRPLPGRRSGLWRRPWAPAIVGGGRWDRLTGVACAFASRDRIPPVAVCLSCLTHDTHPLPDPVPAGYFCPDWRVETWERLGYRRDWGDSSLHDWPRFEILRQDSGRGRSESRVEFVILAPYELRRPLSLHSIMPPGGQLVRAVFLEPRAATVEGEETCGGWTPEGMQGKGYLRNWGDAAVRTWPVFEVLFRCNEEGTTPEGEYLIFSRRLPSPLQLTFPIHPSMRFPAGSY
jgi:ligand-binding SRPBCC domain-containing protein